MILKNYKYLLVFLTVIVPFTWMNNTPRIKTIMAIMTAAITSAMLPLMKSLIRVKGMEHSRSLSFLLSFLLFNKLVKSDWVAY